MWLARVPLLVVFTLAACRPKPAPPAPSARPIASVSATISAIGKRLAAFSTVEGFSVEAQLDAAGQRLVLSGGGCEGFVRLEGSMKLEQ